MGICSFSTPSETVFFPNIIQKIHRAVFHCCIFYKANLKSWGQVHLDSAWHGVCAKMEKNKPIFPKEKEKLNGIGRNIYYLHLER